LLKETVKQKRGDEAGSWRLANFSSLCFWRCGRYRRITLLPLVNLGPSCSRWPGPSSSPPLRGCFISDLSRLSVGAIPITLIGWVRVIGGKIRDPLVGRDVLNWHDLWRLLGVFESADNVLRPLFGGLPPQPGTPSMESLLGIRQTLGSVFAYTWGLCALLAGDFFFLLFLLRLLVRKDWIAAIVIIFLGAITNTGGDYFWMTFLFAAIIWLSIYLILRRFGLLALVVGLVVQNMLVTFPMTSHLSRWYASGGDCGNADHHRDCALRAPQCFGRTGSIQCQSS